MQRVEVAVSMVDVPVIGLRQHIDAVDDVRRRLLADLCVSDHNMTDLVVVCARTIT